MVAALDNPHRSKPHECSFPICAPAFECPDSIRAVPAHQFHRERSPNAQPIVERSVEQLGIPSREFSFLQSFRKRTEIACRDAHRLVRARCGVEDALLLEVHFELSARVAHGVTARVSKRRLLAGFDALAGHGDAQISETGRCRQWRSREVYR